MLTRRVVLFLAALILVASPAALGKTRSGSLTGVVVAEREREDSRELLISVPGSIEKTPVTSVRLEVGRKYAKNAAAGALPEGWSMAADGKWLVFTGPPQSDAVALSARSDQPAPGEELDIEIGSGETTLLEGKVPVRDYELPEAPKDPGDVVQFPPVVPAQGDVGFSAEDDALPPGDWSVGGTKAVEVGEDQYTIGLDLDWSPGLGIDLKYTDDWGETYYEGALDDVDVVPAAAATGDGPRLTDCSPKVLSGGTLCVCGYFPTAASRETLTINGEPLGSPVTSSPWILTFDLPGVPPGEFVVAGPEAAGFPPGSAASGLHISVGGEIDQERLRRGESTPLRLWILGTDEPMTLRLWNETPEIVSLDGGEDQQVTTSGGSPNQLERTVNAVTPGDFVIKYELAGEWCPCAGEIADQVLIEMGGGATTTSSAPCREGSEKCDQLRELAEAATRAANEARAEARRLEANREWIDWESEFIRDSSERTNAYADTLRRQAGDWRELAEDAREMAEECRRRDRELPGNDWDHWAEVYEQDAVRRDQNADRAEAEADAAEGKAGDQEQRAEELEESIEEAVEAAEAAEELAAKARAAYEACLEKLSNECPGVESGTIIYTGPVVIEGPGGVPEEVDPADPNAKICGPEVTELVLEVLDLMVDDFLNKANDQGRENACRNINNLQRDQNGKMIAEYAWDIYALSPNFTPLSEKEYNDTSTKYWLEDMSTICARPRWPCGPTVTFLGQCVHAQVVNYIQWGAMNKLCDSETTGELSHWARATVGGLKTTWDSDFENWQWKSAHYDAQTRMSELGSEFVDQRRESAARSREDIASDLAAQLAAAVAGSAEWASRVSNECAMICRLSADEAKKLRERFFSDPTDPVPAYPYTWVGLDGRQPAETGIIPPRKE